MSATKYNCPDCGCPKHRAGRCRSCALKRSWAQGKRRQTVTSLQRRYQNVQLRKKCGAAARQWFKNESNRQYIGAMVENRQDPTKSIRAKKWWSQPQNHTKMMKIFQSDAFKAKISTRMQLQQTVSHKPLERALKKMSIPFHRGYWVACHRFDYVLYPFSKCPILLDIINTARRRRSQKAKQQFLQLLHLAYKYCGLTGKENNLEDWLLQYL